MQLSGSSSSVGAQDRAIDPMDIHLASAWPTGRVQSKYHPSRSIHCGLSQRR